MNRNDLVTVLTGAGVDVVTAEEIADSLLKRALLHVPLHKARQVLDRDLLNRKTLVQDARVGWWASRNTAFQYKRILDATSEPEPQGSAAVVNALVQTWDADLNRFIESKSLLSQQARSVLQRVFNDVLREVADEQYQGPWELPADFEDLVKVYRKSQKAMDVDSVPFSMVRDYLQAVVERSSSES